MPACVFDLVWTRIPLLHDVLSHRSLQLACTHPIVPSSALNSPQHCLSRSPIEYIQGLPWINSVFVETRLKHPRFWNPISLCSPLHLYITISACSWA